MLKLPKKIIHVLRHFEDAFSERVWEWTKVLLIGAILAPGERTVTAILRVMGLHQERQFQKGAASFFASNSSSATDRSQRVSDDQCCELGEPTSG